MDTITPSNRPPFAWSYSALSNFEKCAKKFYHISIAKDFKETKGEALMWGDTVHAAMAKAVMHHSPLPAEMKKWEHWVKWVREPSDNVVIKVEERLGMTETMQPCEFFDKQQFVWFRTVADVLKINNEVARVVDWKTGKSDVYLDQSTNTWQANSEQLDLAAAVVFAHYPNVELIKLDFVWLAEDFSTTAYLPRDGLPKMWQRLLPRLDKMKRAHATGVYEPTPSGLCIKHCSVKTCQYHGVGSR